MKTPIWRHIAALICGIACLLIVSYLSTLLITLLGSVPIIGALLFYPSDAAWSLVVIPPICSVFAAAKVSDWIAWNHRPTMISVIIIHILGIIGLCIGDDFTLRALISYLFGLGTSILCLASKELE